MEKRKKKLKTEIQHFIQWQGKPFDTMPHQMTTNNNNVENEDKEKMRDLIRCTIKL